MTKTIFKLSPGVQSYDWGKKGSNSLAAQYGKTSVEGFEVDEKKTYAELWMGTHPTLPSKLSSSSSSSSSSQGFQTLSEYIKSNPDKLLGEKVISKFEDSKEGNLPFLFKVLSIGTALSIQAHPDKKLAKRLFEERSDVYKDPNHKPEMAIALTPFLAFLNFLPLPILLLNLLSVPELSELIPSELITQLGQSLNLPTTQPPNSSLYTSTSSSPNEEQKLILKKIFNALMSAKEETVTKAVKALIERYNTKKDISEVEEKVRDLAIMLNDQYPNDVGVLCVFFLNVVELKKGEAAFLEANSPHAYIKGDIIECMATSDNVVRAGLTPKLRDVPTLVEMLTYEAGPGNKQLLKPTIFGSSDEITKLYDPPIEEFSVLRIELSEGEKTKHRKIEGPSIAIITEGKGLVTSKDGEDKVEFARGDVVFIGADEEVEWKAEEDLEVFRAFVEA